MEDALRLKDVCGPLRHTLLQRRKSRVDTFLHDRRYRVSHHGSDRHYSWSARRVATHTTPVAIAFWTQARRSNSPSRCVGGEGKGGGVYNLFQVSQANVWVCLVDSPCLTKPPTKSYWMQPLKDSANGVRKMHCKTVVSEREPTAC